MASYPLTALVLRKTKLGETDVILTLLSEDGREVRAVAKGVRKPGSRFGARLEPYSVVDLLLHTGRSLEVVSEARTVDAHALLREDFDKAAAAAVVADLLDKISVEAQSEPRLFALAEATLDALESADPSRCPQLVVAFLVKALAMHGYRPQLESCVVCAQESASDSRFSPSHGGVICSACGTVDPSSLRVPEVALRWLSALLMGTMAEVAAMDIPAPAVYDCFSLVRSFTAYHVPARMKALDFYGTVLPA